MIVDPSERTHPARPVILLLLIALALPACERPADLSKTHVFSEYGIAFEYAANWNVKERENSSAARIIYIEEPGDALVIISVFRGSARISPRGYADAYASSLSDAIPFGLVKAKVVPRTEETVDVTFTLASAVPHTANVTLHGFERVSVICLTQVADDNRKNVQAGFDLIRRTLRSTE
jgi:hypothetical protein